MVKSNVNVALAVWKFQIPIADDVAIQMPKGAKFLAFQTQNEQPCLWVLVDPAEEKETRRFHVAGTGHPILDGPKLDYIGTCQVRGGALVWHLFELSP